MRPCLALVLLALLAAPAAAQEPASPAPEPRPDKWKAALDVGFTGSIGNTRLAVLTTAVRVKHLQTQIMELDWVASYRYGESDGEVVQRNASTTLTMDVSPRAKWSPFAFATIERDPFRRLDLRSNTGSGLKYTFYRTERGAASMSVAGLYSHESFTNDRPERKDARWSARFKIDQRLGSLLRIENTTFYKPVWNRSGDFNIQLQSRLSTRVTQRVAITFTHEYLHDSTPPAGVAREDQRFQAGATIDFF